MNSLISAASDLALPAWDGLPHNSSFVAVPGFAEPLQVAWDSTSLGALKTCPAYYKYTIVDGWTPRSVSVHLIFGLHYHAALERYDHARTQGHDHQSAHRLALRYALEATWDYDLGRPWDSEDKYKNRETLIRTVSWYLDRFEDDPLETVQLASGKPAVELSFRFETDYPSPAGHNYWLSGHLDRVANFQGNTYIVDRKTSKSTLTPEYFAKYSPDNQFSLYAFASKVVYGTPVQGLIVDAAQVAVTLSDFRRGFVDRSDAVLEEWYLDLGEYLAQAERYARTGYYPRNDKSCNNYGG